MNPDLFASSLSLYNRGVYPKYSLMQKDIESAPQVQHVIIWSQLFPHGVTGKPQQLAYDKAGNYLPGWKLADEQVFTVRIYWDWRERWKWVRRDYVRRNAER